MSVISHKTPSLAGSRHSVYSHASTARTLTRGQGSRSAKLSRLPWYKKPIVNHAFYTDLQRGSWHIGFYTLVLSIWTIFTSGFDIYCLHEANPGSSHTGYYIISFDFVYVGNPHVRNLLVMSSAFSMLGGVALFIFSSLLLDGLRREEETAFRGWLYTMGLFTPWKWVAWAFAGIVNDMIFAYNILMLLVWFFVNIANVFAFICIYSLYLELNDLTKLQDLARLKVDAQSLYSQTQSRAPSVISQSYNFEQIQMDTMSMPASRVASAFGGSRPLSPQAANTQQMAATSYSHPVRHQQLQQQLLPLQQQQHHHMV